VRGGLRLLRRPVVAVPLAAVAAIAVLALVDVGSLDPTDSRYFNDVTFVNDTGRAVELRQCSNATCSRFFDNVRLDPGDRLPRAQVSNRAVLTRFRAADRSTGRALGCRAFLFRHERDAELVVRLSAFRECA
jgi:hypothetical protein